MPRQTAMMRTCEVPGRGAARDVVINERGAALLQVGLGSNSGTEVTIQYPFSFILFDPAVRFVRPASTTGAPLTMSAVAIMRNES